MRNFDERRAEVYRRSKERIKERKRKIKTNIAVIVTPIVLCAFFAGAYFNVVMQPSHDSAPPSYMVPDEDRGNRIDVDDGSIDTEVGAADGETSTPPTAPDTDGLPGDTAPPKDSEKRYVQLEVSVPNSTVTLIRDTVVIKSTVKLLHIFTNGETTIDNFNGNTAEQIPFLPSPKALFTITLTDNFGLAWRYEVTESGITFIPTGKSYPISSEDFDLLTDTLKIDISDRG